MFSAPAELMIYVIVGLYLGVQKTFVSSSLIIILSLLNIILSIFFVRELNLGVSGVALGTLIAAYITITFFLLYTYYFFIKKYKIILKIDFKKIFNFKKIIRLLNINFNIFLRTILLTFSFFWVTYLSSVLGEEYIAINSILMQLIIISSFFLDAYAFSTEGIIAFIRKKSKKMFLTTYTTLFSFFRNNYKYFLFILRNRNYKSFD